MNADKWAVRVFSKANGFCGVVYFPTRREARHFASTFRLPSWMDKGFHAWAGRTGL